MGWNEVGQSAGGQQFMKIEAGAKATMHVLSDEPHSFWQYFNQDIMRGVVLPDGYTMPADKSARCQHAFAVWSYEEEAVKILVQGNQVAEKIKNIFDSYGGSLDDVDLVISRKGTGRNTKYEVVPKPTKWDADLIDGVEIPDLEDRFKPHTVEQVEACQEGIDPREVESGSDSEPVSTQSSNVATKVKPKAVDPRLKLVREVTHLFSTKAKLKNPAARKKAIASVAKGKNSLSQLNVADLKKLKAKIG